MIESEHWKDDLLKFSKKLNNQKFRQFRWLHFNEKQIVNCEKQIVICFFIVRKLFESHKVSQKSLSYKVNIYLNK